MKCPLHSGSKCYMRVKMHAFSVTLCDADNLSKEIHTRDKYRAAAANPTNTGGLISLSLSRSAQRVCTTDPRAQYSLGERQTG